jgi:hypothetical protein
MKTEPKYYTDNLFWQTCPKDKIFERMVARRSYYILLNFKEGLNISRNAGDEKSYAFHFKALKRMVKMGLFEERKVDGKRGNKLYLTEKGRKVLGYINNIERALGNS